MHIAIFLPLYDASLPFHDRNGKSAPKRNEIRRAGTVPAVPDGERDEP
jgi:hypothetical protein